MKAIFDKEELEDEEKTLGELIIMLSKKDTESISPTTCIYCFDYKGHSNKELSKHLIGHLNKEVRYFNRHKRRAYYFINTLRNKKFKHVSKKAIDTALYALGEDVDLNAQKPHKVITSDWLEKQP